MSTNPQVTRADGDDDQHPGTSTTAPTRQEPVSSYTAKQGQYLAFIYYYTKLNRVAPAEADFQRYFGATAPTVHGMILRLEASGWIERTPRKGRSIRLRLTREQLPDLE